jgi:uncharacterized membrane protein (DUF106 family)
MRELENLLAKKFNAEIRALQLKHKQEIEKLKSRQFDLMHDVFQLCSSEPKIEKEFIKVLKA